ncbi:Uncharacterized protein TCM_014434 [Theobroma cacao]|uniref:Uncharacterized protein n=1 Tax=Theobroma cacao TaxID=3641 RepID=A0A061G5C5_THECC|nr:Uncharacterized protein TCM_014434 [Theobroma cacao]
MALNSTLKSFTLQRESYISSHITNFEHRFTIFPDVLIDNWSYNDDFHNVHIKPSSNKFGSSSNSSIALPQTSIDASSHSDIKSNSSNFFCEHIETQNSPILHLLDHYTTSNSSPIPRKTTSQKAITKSLTNLLEPYTYHQAIQHVHWQKVYKWEPKKGIKQGLWLKDIVKGQTKVAFSTGEVGAYKDGNGYPITRYHPMGTRYLNLIIFFKLYYQTPLNYIEVDNHFIRENVIHGIIAARYIHASSRVHKWQICADEIKVFFFMENNIVTLRGWNELRGARPHYTRQSSKAIPPIFIRCRQDIPCVNQLVVPHDRKIVENELQTILVLFYHILPF